MEPRDPPRLTPRQAREAAEYDALADDRAAEDPAFRALDCPVGTGLQQPFSLAVARLGDVRGKKLLDIGCADGRTTVWFALRGADAVGIDVSAEMLRLARRRAEANGVEAAFIQVGAEDLPKVFQAESFDLVWASAALHHLDMPALAAALAAVTRPGAPVVCMPEPISFSQRYQRLRDSRVVQRLLRTSADTADEDVLTVDALAPLRERFDISFVPYYFLTPYALVVFRPRTPQARALGWMLRAFEPDPSLNHYERIMRTMIRLDLALLSSLPMLRFLARQAIVVLRKRA